MLPRACATFTTRQFEGLPIHVTDQLNVGLKRAHRQAVGDKNRQLRQIV